MSLEARMCATCGAPLRRGDADPIAVRSVGRVGLLSSMANLLPRIPATTTTSSRCCGGQRMREAFKRW
jgi:hypothetical protein